jgi:hypothetical protein
MYEKKYFRNFICRNYTKLNKVNKLLCTLVSYLNFNRFVRHFYQTNYSHSQLGHVINNVFHNLYTVYISIIIMNVYFIVLSFFGGLYLNWSALKKKSAFFHLFLQLPVNIHYFTWIKEPNIRR